MKRALVSWSGGKDAAWVAESTREVPIHRIPEHLIAAQAAALGLPLWTVPLPQPCSNVEYAARLRKWREELLSGTAITPVFPLWGQPTRALAMEMLHGGLRATVCAPAHLAGRAFDSAFLDALPPEADPCGENGEFHTFVTGMPGFNREIAECAELFR